METLAEWACWSVFAETTASVTSASCDDVIENWGKLPYAKVLFQAVPKTTRQVWRAIIRSSFVGITLTIHLLSDVLITSACSEFRS